jgi:hypothetical protein
VLFFFSKREVVFSYRLSIKKKKDKAQNDKKNLAENNNEEKIYENN